MYKYYIRLDADNIGDKIEYFLLCNDWEKARDIHNKIQNSMEIIGEFVRGNEDYILLMTGCDDLLIGTNEESVLKVAVFTESIRNHFNKLCNETLSAGIGNSIVEAIMNLRKAKTGGKNNIVH
ncbi:mCpol domain-containing protein [Paenibacillus sp. KS-LC4]|uniref:mCpol domain-containing protein n=1 Tax=Paenibacillus sp. KS-LC4 TaxID=2979727 RepID=UPI0030CCE850